MDTHSGAAIDGRPWSARLIVVEVAHLHALADDPDTDILADAVFPDPVLTDPELATGFLELHRSLETLTRRPEQDEKLAEWLHALIERHTAHRPTRPPLAGRDDRALRLALEYLAERPERNDELAVAAGIRKFRLVRLFRERTGLPSTRCRSPTGSAPPAACSKLAEPSPPPQLPPDSPTKATSTATSRPRWAGPDYQRRISSAEGRR